MPPAIDIMNYMHKLLMRHNQKRNDTPAGQKCNWDWRRKNRLLVHLIASGSGTRTAPGSPIAVRYTTVCTSGIWMKHCPCVRDYIIYSTFLKPHTENTVYNSCCPASQHLHKINTELKSLPRPYRTHHICCLPGSLRSSPRQNHCLIRATLLQNKIPSIVLDSLLYIEWFSSNYSERSV